VEEDLEYLDPVGLAEPHFQAYVDRVVELLRMSWGNRIMLMTFKDLYDAKDINDWRWLFLHDWKAGSGARRKDEGREPFRIDPESRLLELEKLLANWPAPNHRKQRIKLNKMGNVIRKEMRRWKRKVKSKQN